MKFNKIYKKTIVLFLISFIILNILFIKVSPIGSINNEQNQTGVEENSPNKAFSEISIDLTESTTSYERETDANVDLNFFPDDLYRRYQIIADLTTHRELYLQFFIQWDTETAPWPDFDAFNNSPLVMNFRDNNEALRQLVLNEEVVQVLDVSSSSFRTHSFTFTEFLESNADQGINKTFWEIEQKIVVKETTAFLLNLFEPFNFDLNEVELGSLTNFKFESEFFVEDENIAFIHEKIQLSAQGSILKTNSTTKGYNADFAFSDFNPETLGNFYRAFTDLPQIIEYKVSIPSTQQITGFNVDKRYSNAPNAKENLLIVDKDQKYIFTVRFTTNDLQPVYIRFTAAPPELEIWQQFSLSDYLSFMGSLVIALVTIVKGLPYYFSRRNTGGYKKKLHKAVLKNDWKDFETVKQHALDKYLKGKLSLRQIQSILEHIKVIKENIETVNNLVQSPQEKETAENY